jgi:outer membrane protein
MKKRVITTLLAALVLSMAIAPAAIAADLTDVGFLDQAALGSLPAFLAANQQLAQYHDQLNGQFESAMRSAKDDADKQRISLQFQQEFQDKQREVLNPLLARAQAAIANVAASKKLSVVVDKRIIIYGGTDITKDVIDLVRGTQALAMPQSPPPASPIGFVDEQSLDTSQKVKDANDVLAKFAEDQRNLAAQKLKTAKNDIDKQQIAADYQKALADKQEQLLKPLISETRAVTATIAKQKTLLLVIDRADIVYGGTDITQDVQNALNK